jgi:hypothetical protein
MSASTPAGLGRIFISYRRDDSAFPAGWLYDRLCAHLSSDQVFKDVDSIEPGDDFVRVLEDAVGSCHVLLALIGDRWLDITDETGNRRLDEPDDFVRIEIEAALRRDVRVVPILVGRAPMPRSEQLPDSLRGLTRRHAIQLSPNRFDSDLARLLLVIDKTLAAIRDGPAKTPADASGVSQAPTSTVEEQESDQHSGSGTDLGQTSPANATDRELATKPRVPAPDVAEATRRSTQEQTPAVVDDIATQGQASAPAEAPAKRTVRCPLCDAEQRIPATTAKFTCGRCKEISPAPKRTVICPLCEAEQRIPPTATRFKCGRCKEISPAFA